MTHNSFAHALTNITKPKSVKYRHQKHSRDGTATYGVRRRVFEAGWLAEDIPGQSYLTGQSIPTLHSTTINLPVKLS